jgi:hypothetical protein
MKNRFFVLLLLVVAGAKVSAQTYCSAFSVHNCENDVEYISNISLNGINNSSICSQFSDYTAQSTSIAIGLPYSISISIGIVGSSNIAYIGNQLAVWIDFNNNGIFDSTELIGLTTVGQGTSFPVIYNFTVPTNAAIGNTRMRVRLNYQPEDGNIIPCGINQWGETEDYNVNITQCPTGLQNEITINACESYVWPANNQTYLQSGAYTSVLLNSAGCDSLVALNLTINQPDLVIQTISACDAFLWNVNNQIYYESGQYSVSFINQNGCDSTIILNLIINETSNIIETVTACNSYFWLVNGQNYSQSGQYSELFVNAAGCDSLITLNLSIESLNILNQPSNQDLIINDNAIFSIDLSDPNATYQWQTNLGLGFQNLTDAGQYSGSATNTLSISNVTLSNNNQQFRCIVNSSSCSDTSSVAILTVVDNVGIEDQNQLQLLVYPNPASSTLTIENPQGLISNFVVVDARGREVHSGTLNTATTLNLHAFPAGVYTILFENTALREVKVVKE